MKVLSPKDEFLQSQAATPFAELIGNPVMRTGIEVALLEFVQRQPHPDRLETAASQAHELQGARALVSILINLVESEEVHRPESHTNLIWQPRKSQHAPPPQQQPVQAPPSRPVNLPPQPPQKSQKPRSQP